MREFTYVTLYLLCGVLHLFKVLSWRKIDLVRWRSIALSIVLPLSISTPHLAAHKIDLGIAAAYAGFALLSDKDAH